MTALRFPDGSRKKMASPFNHSSKRLYRPLFEKRFPSSEPEGLTLAFMLLHKPPTSIPQTFLTAIVCASLNALLPPEIRILRIDDVHDSFHARYDAKAKEYHYRLHLDRIPDPFKRLYSYHVLYRLDLDVMSEAAKLLLGEHDFKSFANEADEGSASKNSVRTLSRLDLIPEVGGVRLEFEGDGFLYKMVRNITGTLLEIARGKIPLSTLQHILNSKDRRTAGPSAPAHGLCLAKVIY